MFTREPQGTVYIPPAGLPGRYAVCATNESANIVWRYEDTVETVLDPTIYGITTLPPTSSRIFLTYAFVQNLPVKFVTTSVHCEAGNVNSSSFGFRNGGRYTRTYIYVVSIYSIVLGLILYMYVVVSGELCRFLVALYYVTSW